MFSRFQSIFLLKIIILYIILSSIGIDFIKNLPILLPILLSVAFFTVLERKVLASMQRRRGPNVVGIYGLLQAIADAFKLLSKETLIPSGSNFFLFILSPIFTFVISMLC
jgi:NADH-quinone oxidoreductase subunit H